MERGKDAICRGVRRSVRGQSLNQLGSAHKISDSPPKNADAATRGLLSNSALFVDHNQFYVAVPVAGTIVKRRLDDDIRGICFRGRGIKIGPRGISSADRLLPLPVREVSCGGPIDV